MKIDPITPSSSQPVPARRGIADSGVRPKRQKSKRTKYTVWGALMALLLLITFSAESIDDATTVWSYDESSEITELADRSGMGMHGKAVFYKTDPQLVTVSTLYKNCPSEGADSITFGCYLPEKGKIYILRITQGGFKQSMYATAAHEMLHAAWHQLPDSDRYAVSDDVRSTLKSKAPGVKTVIESLQNYPDNKAIKADEAHAFVGSEIHDSNMTPSLVAHYSRYFSNRDRSVQANFDYEEFTTQTYAALEKERKAIDADAKQLEQYKAKWLDQIKAYMDQNRYYGDYVTYNKNVAAYNNNRTKYNRMISSYNERLRLHNRQVNELNKYTDSLSLPSSKRPKNST